MLDGIEEGLIITYKLETISLTETSAIHLKISMNIILPCLFDISYLISLSQFAV